MSAASMASPARPALRRMVAGASTLVASPSSYALLAVTALTVVVKASVARGLSSGEPWLGVSVWAGSVDVAVYLALVALLAAAEARLRFGRPLAWTAALLLATLAGINAIYLYIAGEQLGREPIVVGSARFLDIWEIFMELVGHAPKGALLVGGVLLMLPPLLLARRRRGDSERNDGSLSAAIVAGGALALHVAMPAPTTPSAQRLGTNAAVVTTLSSLARGDTTGTFTGYVPREFVPAAEIARFAAGSRPNVLLLVLESTRFDHTSLSPTPQASTPNLFQLAGRGAWCTHARAVIPHTTKSLFVMLTGRLPSMQPVLVEPGWRFPTQALPRILRDAGYRTAFYQSAAREYEDRPHLVANIGYEQFLALEDLQGERLGYLASDDQSLVAPARRFMEESRAAGSPFFLTLLTSSTHHPYRLTRAVAERAAREALPIATDEERYARNVESEDHLLGGVLDALHDLSMDDSTVVVVLGDHGEGFGEKGVRQHANNTWEEGLRVPLVFAGPGVPVRRIEGNVSLLDVTPTLLGILGVAYDPQALAGAHDVHLSDPPDEPRPFSSLLPGRGRGFVWGRLKVVHMAEADVTYTFDLQRDPEERSPIPMASDVRRALVRELAALENH